MVPGAESPGIPEKKGRDFAVYIVRLICPIQTTQKLGRDECGFSPRWVWINGNTIRVCGS